MRILSKIQIRNKLNGIVYQMIISFLSLSAIFLLIYIFITRTSVTKVKHAALLVQWFRILGKIINKLDNRFVSRFELD